MRESQIISQLCEQLRDAFKDEQIGFRIDICHMARVKELEAECAMLKKKLVDVQEGLSVERAGPDWKAMYEKAEIERAALSQEVERLHGKIPTPQCPTCGSWNVKLIRGTQPFRCEACSTTWGWQAAEQCASQVISSEGGLA